MNFFKFLWNLFFDFVDNLRIVCIEAEIKKLEERVRDGEGLPEETLAEMEMVKKAIERLETHPHRLATP